jgi:predicted peptidase
LQQEGGKAALAALDQPIREFRGDTQRVYLTGLSAGANGSWFLLSHYPERFAAAVVLPHNAWDPAYARVDVFEWLLKKTLTLSRFD